MKTALRIFLIGIAIMVGGFSFGHLAKAEIVSSHGGTTDIQNTMQINPIVNLNASTTYITAIKVNIGYSSCSGSPNMSTYPSGSLVLNGYSVVASGYADKNLSQLPQNDVTAVIFTVSPPVAVNGNFSGFFELGNFSTCTRLIDVANYVIEGITTINGNDSYVYFPNPPFQQGMISTDFGSWQVCVSVPTSSNVSMFDVKVEYGTSSPFFLDSLSSRVGLIPTNGSAINNDCYLIEKTHDLAPGNYNATAYVFDQNDTSINISDRLIFTIATGTKTSFAAEAQNEAKVPPCQDTSFSVLGADFGKGVCTLFRFLFVPSDSVVRDGEELYTSIQAKVPFSYFNEIKDIITNAGTGTAQSMPEVKITTSATSSVPNMNIVLFSSSTISAATSRSGFSVLRTLANVVLYLGFAMMCYETAIHLAHKKGNS